MATTRGAVAVALHAQRQGSLPPRGVGDREGGGGGFRLAARSRINANPKDTRDHPKGVWTLPLEYALKDVDRKKYAAIGESDRMTLKFVRIEKGAAR